MPSIAPKMERYRNYVPPRGVLGGIVGATEGSPGTGAGGDSPLDRHASVTAGLTVRPWPTGSRRHYRKSETHA